MIVDWILDRKDGEPYNAQEFYRYALEGDYESIARALESNNEDEIRKALKEYLDGNMFNPQIKEYIDSVSWTGNIKPKSWHKYYCVSWNNYMGEGYVYNRIITDEEIEKAGGLWSWTDKNRCVLYKTEREAQQDLDYHYYD